MISSLQVNSANLVFNQILSIKGQTNYNTTQDYFIGVVPIGKTWKVEGISVLQPQYISPISNRFKLLVNGISTSISNNWWLKAGDSIVLSQENIYSGYANLHYNFSIIEYNIVP